MQLPCWEQLRNTIRRGFSNSSMWPLLHWMTPYARFKANLGRGQLKIQYCFCFLAVAGLASRICLTHSRASCFIFILEIGTDCFHSPGWVLHLVLQSNDVQWALCCFTVLAERSLPDEHLSEHLQHPFPLEIWNLEPAYPQSTKILRPLGLRMFKALLFCSDSDTPPWHASSAIVALATARARTDRRTESDDQILLMLFVALTHSRNVVRSSRSISEHHQKRDQKHASDPPCRHTGGWMSSLLMWSFQWPAQQQTRILHHFATE